MLESNISKYLKKSKYRREYIQEYMNVSANTLSNWSTGKTEPTVENLFKLADLLEVKVDELYTFEREE